jgi:hypothetical protein
MRVMDPQEYQRRAEACLRRVAEWLEGLDPDEVDYSAGQWPDSLSRVAGIEEN